MSWDGTTEREADVGRGAILAIRKSMSLGLTDISFQSRPPSRSIGLPALFAPENWASIIAFRRSYCSSESVAGFRLDR